MAYLIDCGCEQRVDLCGERERVCETACIGGELVTRCHEHCLPVERLCCAELC